MIKPELPTHKNIFSVWASVSGIKANKNSTAKTVASNSKSIERIKRIKAIFICYIIKTLQ